MFKAHVEKKWNTDETEVFLVETQRIAGAQTYYTVEKGLLTGHTVTAGAPIEPFLTLPRDAAEALGLAMANVLPPSQATAVHLKDAIEVRDRVLTIVEGLCWPRGDKVERQ